MGIETDVFLEMARVYLIHLEINLPPDPDREKEKKAAGAEIVRILELYAFSGPEAFALLLSILVTGIGAAQLIDAVKAGRQSGSVQ